MAVSRGVKRLRHEANHLPPNAKVSNEWSYTSTPSTCLHGVHRINYTIHPDEGCYCLGCDALYGVEQNRIEQYVGSSLSVLMYVSLFDRLFVLLKQMSKLWEPFSFNKVPGGP